MADERIDEMAKTMKAAGIAEMKAELEAAGYTIYLTSNHVRHTSVITSPSHWSYSPNVEISGDAFFKESQAELEDMVTVAYAHLQEKRRLAELEAHNRRLLDVAREQQKAIEAYEAFVNEVAELRLDLGVDASYGDINDYENVVEKAKKLTGKE